MITKKPKFKAVVIQIAEFTSDNKYIKGTNHRLRVFDTSHDKVFRVIENALETESKKKVMEKK